jgi:hypothetical protein
MIVDGPGGASGDRTDRGAGSTSDYGSYYRATGGSDGNTSDGTANMMMATVDGTVVPGVPTVIRGVGRSSRDKAQD